ncbi:serine/threonine protein kinase [Streptomyces longisporoflavus]|uniref:class III lanthionine synthetase LanKC n=1 Tax=Streptomyces longisporoflavus TaxID=28044 RepID=UPI00167E0BAB|nr:class III lanthionine synthetase LanKC [Streptomyces longisporoflavus]GGV38112.1 serine/threonine protein kinase [Streptomyces longisporoflavus]
MDKRYEVYCLADRHFYETPDRLSVGGSAPEFGTAQRPVPQGWRSARQGDWLTLVPVDEDGHAKPAPQQGWKIHVSATLENADRIAAAVWDHCVPRSVPFKFIAGRPLLHLRNSKYAGRDGSGKFATIYPADEHQLHSLLSELGQTLAGFEGPYILTDLRWQEGPLYVRYGAFTRRMCVDERGGLVPAIEDDRGRLVPDSRDPAFRVPEWVTLPPFLESQLAARNNTTVTDLPYRMEKALHFSNGGGVYVGTDTRDGRKVVLKEGRPHAGLASDGADAVARLERERDALGKLAGLGVAPEVRDWFELGGHRFLVMDFLEGRTLNSFFADRHPLLVSEPDADAVAAYTAWALRIHRAVEEAVAAVHERGVVFNDLHMFNIMVAPDEQSVSLLDFEAATRVGDGGRQVVAHPGFMAPADREGVDVDSYALACLRLALFLPITTLLAVDRGKAAHLAKVIAAEFPDVPPEFLAAAVAEIERGGDGVTRGARSGATTGATTGAAAPLVDLADWPAGRDSMAKAILASATPERDDRLFPGDIATFSDGGGLGLAHGAAGVLYALAESGAERYEEGERWLLKHTESAPTGTPLGLNDGLAGIAHVLERLGHRTRALDLMESVLQENWQRLPSDLNGGLAGLGLALDSLAHRTGEEALAQHALRAAELIGERLTAGPPPKGRPRAGLLHGDTGPALLFLRLYERNGDPALLDLAARALRADLDRCVARPDGSLGVDEGWRTMPYLGDGSVGIGMVIDDYLAHRDDAGFEAARPGILATARSRFCVQPGLFQGRAGLLLHINRSTAPGITPGDVAAQIEGLGWFTMPYAGHIAFPGNQMLRLSMDLHTGTAGCLLALAAALGDGGAHVPFLPPLRRPQSRSRESAGS